MTKVYVYAQNTVTKILYHVGACLAFKVFRIFQT